MRTVIHEDERGNKRAYLLRDSDPDHLAPSGIPLGPPDLNRLDWDGLVRDLQNLLVKKGLFTWDDVQRAQNGVTSSIVTVMKRPIIGLFKTEEKPNG